MYYICLSLGSDLRDGQSLLLSQHHNLESLKVRKVGSSLSDGQLLGPRGGSPLAVDVGSSPLLVNSGGSGTSWQSLQHKGGQHNLVQRDGLSLNSGTVNQDLAVSIMFGKGLLISEGGFQVELMDYGFWGILTRNGGFGHANSTVVFVSARRTRRCAWLLDIWENGHFRRRLHTLFWSMISTMVANLELSINTIRPVSTYLQLAVFTVVDMIRVWKKLENLRKLLFQHKIFFFQPSLPVDGTADNPLFLTISRCTLLEAAHCERVPYCR